MVDDLSSTVLGIYGAGGFGREIVNIANQSLVKKIGKNISSKVYFIESSPKMREINGYTLISEEEFISIKCKKIDCLHVSEHTEQNHYLLLDIKPEFKTLDDCYS